MNYSVLLRRFRRLQEFEQIIWSEILVPLGASWCSGQPAVCCEALQYKGRCHSYWGVRTDHITNAWCRISCWWWVVWLIIKLFSILNSDTLFKEDFSISKIRERFSDLQAECENSCLVLSYQCKDEGEYTYAQLGANEAIMHAEHIYRTQLRTSLSGYNTADSITEEVWLEDPEWKETITLTGPTWLSLMFTNYFVLCFLCRNSKIRDTGSRQWLTCRLYEGETSSLWDKVEKSSKFTALHRASCKTYTLCLISWWCFNEKSFLSLASKLRFLLILLFVSKTKSRLGRCLAALSKSRVTICKSSNSPDIIMKIITPKSTFEPQSRIQFKSSLWNKCGNVLWAN